MNLDKVKELTTMISDKISQRVDKDNADSICYRLEELTALQATAAYALSLSEMVYNEKLSSLVMQPEYKSYTATDKKMVFAGLAKEEIFYMTLSERLAKNISYSIEAMRSLLSFLKQEMTNAKYQTT